MDEEHYSSVLGLRGWAVHVTLYTDHLLYFSDYQGSHSHGLLWNPLQGHPGLCSLVSHWKCPLCPKTLVGANPFSFSIRTSPDLQIFWQNPISTGQRKQPRTPAESWVEEEREISKIMPGFEQAGVAVQYISFAQASGDHKGIKW